MTRVLLGLALTAAACGEKAGAPAPTLDEPFPPDAAADLALEFDGLDDYATMGCAELPHAEERLTMSLRFRWGGGTGRQALLVTRKDGESGFRLQVEDGVPGVERVWGNRTLGNAPAIREGEWHHLAYVSSGGPMATHRVYLDGVEVSRMDYEPTNRSPTSAWLGTIDGVTELYRGALDDVRIWRGSRTREEIAAEAAGDVPDQHPALAAYWSFNESGGSRAMDRSGNGNHAVLGDGVAEYAPSRRPR